MEMTEALSGDFMEMVGPMMAAAVHGEDAAMAQAEGAGGAGRGRSGGEEASQPVDIFSYDSISGYGAAVARMRSLGVGLAGTPEFDDFVAMLNSRHGLDAMPVVDSLLFCSPAREDASRFMLATVGGSWDYWPSACAWRRPSKACPCSASAPRPPMPRSSLACATALRARASWCWRISICGERRSSMPPTIWRASSWPPCPGARGRR
ncbi:MAG: hypothetical protein ACLTDR_05965 [Adlercreutzia equolifaciens]